MEIAGWQVRAVGRVMENFPSEVLQQISANWITARWACLEESMAWSLTVISLLFQSTTHCRYRVYTKFLLTYTAIYRRNCKVLLLGIMALQPVPLSLGHALYMLLGLPTVTVILPIKKYPTLMHPISSWSSNHALDQSWACFIFTGAASHASVAQPVSCTIIT